MEEVEGQVPLPFSSHRFRKVQRVLTLYSPLILENLLPYPISCSILREDQSSIPCLTIPLHHLIFVVEIAPAEAKPIYFVNPYQNAHMGFKLAGNSS
jgi:hypothetical protein